METIDGQVALGTSRNGSNGPTTSEIPATDTPGTTELQPQAAAATPAAAHIRQLTGIRALAALWVLTFHFRPELLAAFPFLWPAVPMFNVGYLGVDLFFVLSGFILTYTHLDRMTEKFGPRKVVGFLWLRLSRIWPLLFVMLLVWGVYNASLLLHSGDGRLQQALDPERFLQHALLIQAWGTHHHDWNPIDWSLSAEWLAYLAFGVLVVLLAKFRALLSSRALMLLAFIAVLPVVLVGLGFQDGSDLLWNNDSLVGGMVPLRVLAEFAGGALVSLLVLRHGPKVRLPWFLRPTVVLVVVVAGIYLIERFDPVVRLRFDQPWLYNGHSLWGSTETVLVVPLFLLLIGSLAVSGRDVATRFLATRVLVWGGKVSFALYLCHWLFLDVLRRSIANLNVGGAPTGWTYRVLVLLAVAGAIVFAHLLYRFVEEPCRRAMRRMLPNSMRV
jgi:peptidoglycan/LPS O-acetylase OafA/YrhL